MTIAKLINQLKDECSTIKRIQATLRTTMEEKSGNWKMDYIGGRKQLSLAYGRLANIANDLLPLVTEASVAKAFRDALATMRHKTAVHQASWPVVTIDATGQEYRESLRQLETVNAQFHAATDTLLRWAEHYDANI